MRLTVLRASTTEALETKFNKFAEVHGKEIVDVQFAQDGVAYLIAVFHEDNTAREQHGKLRVVPEE